MKKTAIELFAGVGGFRIGLNEVSLDETGNTIEQQNFDFVWANQWEPATRVQHAFECYEKRFGKSPNHSNVDISKVDKAKIPDHSLLVGGFPCQDYSVARTLSNEKGIEGKKGVLWWQINEILQVKRPPFLLLENVDRLLKSPSRQRGRDFGIMLRCLNDLGYGVEWRVINGADYGFPQKRRRVYIFGFHNTTEHYKRFSNYNATHIIDHEGIFARTFPIEASHGQLNVNLSTEFSGSLIEMSESFQFPFRSAGVLLNNIVHTSNITPIVEQPLSLGQILEQFNIPEYCFLTDRQIEKFTFLKGSKKINRTSKTGLNYNYSEGAMCFPDNLEGPGRTMLTSEGTINRSTHVVTDIETNQLRTLTPIEAERLNQFPDNWTNTGMSYRQRYFMMGNALIVGIVQRLGQVIQEIINHEN